MDKDRLLKEAQLIAQNFSFFMVKGQLSHLYGYIYETDDGKKYAMDIIFDEDFPEEPPQLSFRQEIPNLPAEIELETLNSWTENSHVVDVVAELAGIVKMAVKGEQSLPQMEEIPKQQPVLQEETEKEGKGKPEHPKPPSVGSLDSPSQPEQPESESQDMTASEDSSQDEEYVTPDLNAYPDDNVTEYITPQEYPQWKPEDLPEQIIQEEQPDVKQEPEQSTKETTTEKEESKQETEYSPEEIIDTQDQEDVKLATEAVLIQQEYAMDYIENSLSKVEIYLTITIEQTFIIKIDFEDYPERPKLDLPQGLQKMVGDINEYLEILKKWNKDNPPHVVEIIRELESKLWFLSELELEAKMITGEYKAEMIDGFISKLNVTIYTYGFKEYTLKVDISNYPAPPKIEFPDELKQLVETPIENVKGYKNWKRKESHTVEVLREIQWLIDKNSRINFELKLLRGGMKEVNFNASENSIYVKLSGKMKTEGVVFDFKVELPADYPVGVPKIELKSELEGREDLREKLVSQIGSFRTGWHQFNYLIDLFNQISKAIFEVSVISCVICHKIECPQCGLKISASNPDEQCQVSCPSCERLYHKSCWNQTIASFKKCGFCLRPPPPNMMHVD
ncbi:MAG: hypothetical protein GF364_18435 [Candidatus Lokiarchaeota archaeon]|nr:hypothetical protein [Candidatus Lokiarchaeota archaeon]